MTTIENRQTHITDFRSRLAQMDLRPIIFKLCHLGDGAGWTQTKAAAVEVWYRRYHEIVFLFPSEKIVPTKEIDEFWHYHILDTQKYHDDCYALHGRFLHHFPYFGLRGAADREELGRAFESSLALFQTVYGELPNGRLGRSAMCSSDCSFGFVGLTPVERPITLNGHEGS